MLQRRGLARLGLRFFMVPALRLNPQPEGLSYSPTSNPTGGRIEPSGRERGGCKYNPSPMRIHLVDLAIVITYLLAVTALGIYFRRGQQGARDYFLGGRSAPWWALAFSIVATETSTLTIIGT